MAALDYDGVQPKQDFIVISTYAFYEHMCAEVRSSAYHHMPLLSHFRYELSTPNLVSKVLGKELIKNELLLTGQLMTPYGKCRYDSNCYKSSREGRLRGACFPQAVLFV